MRTEYPAFVEVNDEFFASKQLIAKGLVTVDELRAMPTFGKRAKRLHRAATLLVRARQDAKRAARSVGWE